METVLQPEVAAVYSTSVPAGKRYYNGFGVYDLADISLGVANSLYKRGFKYLTLLPAIATKKTAAPSIAASASPGTDQAQAVQTP